MKQKIPLLILMLIAAVFFIIAGGSVLRSHNIKKLGFTTEASVIQINRSSKGGSSTVTVSYATSDGKVITATSTTRKIVFRGEKVMIFYDPDFPERIDFGDTIGYNMRGVVIGFLLFFLGLFFLLRMIIKGNTDKKLITTGRKIAAEFVSIVRNEKYRMGDKNPWMIKCKWIDLRDNREYFFLSKDYTIDPATYMEARNTITVYIDPANPSKYFMDTSFMPQGNNTIG